MSNPAAHRSWLSRLVEVPAGRLNSVLLRPQRLDSWILLRSGVGTLVVFWAMILLPDLNDLYGPTSIVPSQGPRPAQLSIFRWWSLDVAGLLKIRGSELQQRYSELMMLAGGPCAVPYLHEAMDGGWQGDIAIDRFLLPLAGSYFNQRKTTIYGGSNEVQRNIVAQTVLG